MAAVKESSSLKGELTHYYERLGSRAIYDLMLGGAKHLGYYTADDRIWEFKKPQRQMQEHLAADLNLSPGAKVLDAGCGMGEVAAFLAKNYAFSVTGVDLLDFDIREAKQRAKAKGISDKVDFITGDYTQMSFEDSCFDGIYTMETFVHVPNTAEALANFYRILKPGGRLVMHEYSHAPTEEMPPKVYKAMSLINRLVVMPGFQKFNHGTLESLLEESGFIDVDSKDITENIKPMMKVFALLTGGPYLVSKAFGYRPKMPNAMTAFEIYRNQDYFRYNVITANKSPASA